MTNDSVQNDKMKKRMRIMLISVGVLFGSIFVYKGFSAIMLKIFMGRQSQVVEVSTMKAGYSLWQPELKAVGSLRAIRGVSVTTELAGMVQTIYFNPGAVVKQGSELVQLNIDSDVAELHSLQANAELAKTIYVRDKAQYAAQAISKATLDTDQANLKSTEAQVAVEIATINKKKISAPFAGRLGISAVNPGQYVNPGDKVVTLQQLDPIYVDFYVPQQAMDQVSIGQSINMSVDAFSDKTFTGKITTIDPIVDSTTRNVEVEATVANSTLKLVPGMFSTVNVTTGSSERYLTLPQTAITFNPYGSLVYVVKTGDKKKLTAVQSFVTTGETRGDQIIILKGLKEGDEIVTSGQLKLKNGSQVAINNTVVPTNNPTPNLPNE